MPARPVPPDAENDEAQENAVSFPIVGIGASAGGIEACSSLLKALPEDTGMAFVVILHISADSPSYLTQIFGGITHLPVVPVAQDLLIQPNHIYTIVPDRQITLTEGRLRLAPRDPDERPFMPIDRFFGSLATQSGQPGGSVAVGVVLSGLDGDGAKGLERIREAGGFTFAQTRNSARFDGMPNTAAETGMVDFILPPAEIARQLAEMANLPYLSERAIAFQSAEAAERSEAQSRTGETNPTGIRSTEIHRLLRSHTGIDFTQYKQATFNRRVRRRMGLYQLIDEAEYADYLREHPEEIGALYRDVLITVTGFFRDAEAFAFISDVVLPALIQQKGLESPIRIWVAGCSSGEECYSLAICLLEALSAQNLNLSVQIFGTDASEDAVKKARHGTYTESQMAGVSPERRQRFFTRADGRYQVSKAVRELCIFARQDLSSDPPFSGIDLVSCRNVMIYFGRVLQTRVRAIFHYSLNMGGYLWLGSSESVGETSELFSAVDRKHKVYSRRATATRLNFDFVVASAQGLPEPRVVTAEAIPIDPNRYANVRHQADQIMLGRYAPVGVVVDKKLEILHFRGDTNLYLAVAPGEPSFSLLKMARPELGLALRSALEQAKEQNVVARKTGLQIENSSRYVTLEVTPIRDPVSQVRNYLVLFEEGALINAPPKLSEADQTDQPASSEVSQLESVLAATRRELTDTQAYLQAMVEEKEGTNQQLTTANEEILSSNEELQSTNEELQTAKEEIQAANEELKTTNEELQDRNKNSQSINNDLLNLLSNISLPIVILSSDLRIRRFTPVAQELFNLIPTDVGRLLSDIRIDIDVPDLEQMVLATIDSLDAQEREVQDSQGRWYQLRIRPYRTAENQIDGAVMALVDVTDIKQVQQALERSRNYAEAIVETVSEPLLVVSEVLDSKDLIVRTANRAFYETFQVSHLATDGRSLFALGKGHWDTPEMRSCLSSLLDKPQDGARRIDSLELTREFEHIGVRTMLVKAREIQRSDSERLILLSTEDITERRQTEAERDRAMVQAEAARAEAEAANIGKDQFLSVISHELRSPLNAILGWSSLLTRAGNTKPEMWQKALPSIHRSAQTQSRVIGDLLEVSRIVQGKLSLQTEPVNLNDLLAAVCELTQPTADSAEVEIVSELEANTDYFLLDADRLHQVFGNALSNAIKFTPAGGQIRLSLTYEMSADGVRPQARVLVADNGAGISADFLPYIFDRFRQADSTNIRQYGGLGLGLAIVKSFVEAHGGTVDISSPGEGQGSTLTVLLPLTPVTPGSPASPVLANDSRRLDNLCLLLVEDNLESLEMMQTALTLQGATVLLAESVDRAIKWLTSDRQIDAIVSDISLPERDGFDLIRWVRSHSTKRINQLPAIAVTGHVTPANTDSLLTSGFNQHLVKPVQIETLVNAILAVCR